jgi:hypothetical protein
LVCLAYNLKRLHRLALDHEKRGFLKSDRLLAHHPRV